MAKKMIGFDQIRLSPDYCDVKQDNKDFSDNDIAVIGMACKFPMSDDIDDFWQVLRNEVECICDFPEYRKKDVEKYLDYTGMFKKDRPEFLKAGYINEIDKFDYKFFNMTPNEAKVMDPNHRLFLQTAWNALEDAGYGGKSLRGSKTGVYVGYKCALSNVYQKYISDTRPNLIPVSIFGNKPPMLASRISYFLDLKGPSMLIDTACSATLVAMHLAARGIRNGDCDMALVGSCKLIAVPVDGLEESIGIEADDFRTRTFDDNSNGTCPGEGVGVVLLKKLSKAVADRDNIYAVIKGSALNQNGSSIAVAVPSADAQAEVIGNAWLDAGVNPESISYIETHGTATRLGDPIEVDGLKRAFEKFTNKKQFCAIGGVKTNIGHLDNSSSIAAFIKAVLALRNKEIPASINYHVPNRNIDFINSPVYVNYKLTKWERKGGPRRCGVTGVGLNGTNCHIVLEEAPEKAEIAGFFEHPEMFVLSAESENSLKMYIKRYKKLLDEKKNLPVKDLVFTANTGKGQYSHRLAFVFDSENDFIQKLRMLNTLDLEKNNEKHEVYYKWESPDMKVYKVSEEVLHTQGKKDISIEANRLICAFSDKDKKDRDLLNQICRLYIRGAELNWAEFYKGEIRSRISTPAYPFEPTRCWVEVPSNKQRFALENIDDILSNQLIPEGIAAELAGAYEKYKNYISEMVDADREYGNAVKLSGRESGEYSGTEMSVAEVWRDMLGYEELNINHTLFDLGGDSVLALKIVHQVNEKLKVDLKTVDLLKNPSVQSFSRVVEEALQQVEC